MFLVCFAFLLHMFSTLSSALKEFIVLHYPFRCHVTLCDYLIICWKSEKEAHSLNGATCVGSDKVKKNNTHFVSFTNVLYINCWV